jgi:hypothetical protein
VGQCLAVVPSRTAVIRGVLLLLAVLAADPGLAAKNKKKCKKLCRATVSACVTTACVDLPRKEQRQCRRGCKRSTIAACKLDTDTTRCLAPSGTSDAAQIAGRVVRQEPGQQVGVPVPGAQVRAGVDRNADGTLAGDEAVSTTTAADGAYQLQMSAVPGKTAVVQFRAPEAVPVIRTLRLTPGANVLLNVKLQDMAALQCTGNRCVGVDDKLNLFGAPANARAAASIFDPAQQPDAAPGGSLDRDGQLLRSATFAVVELTDDTTGQPITTLPSPAELCLAVPADTRAVLIDVAPGTGQIEMPLFFFDEVGGAWVPEGQAVLKDASNAAIPEDALASVRDGTFPGAVNACGTVNHLTWWNVALPSGQAACLSLDLRDANGGPAIGATAFFAGVTYFGLSDVLAADANGNVCGVVPRSEAAGEDLDGNGIAGEQARTRIRAQLGNKTFDGGEVVDDVQAGTCPCAARTITLSSANELTGRVCTLTGRVLDRTGAPAAGAEVIAIDSSITQEDFTSLCGLGQCTFVAFAGADGSFSLTSPVINQLEVAAFSVDPQNPGADQLTLPGCPAGPVDLVLE